jgi:hypothetical protein
LNVINSCALMLISILILCSTGSLILFLQANYASALRFLQEKNGCQLSFWEETVIFYTLSLSSTRDRKRRFCRTYSWRSCWWCFCTATGYLFIRHVL